MRSNRISMLLAAGALSAAAGCAHKKAEPAPSKPTGPTTVQKTLADVGLDAAAMDRTADPCVDFYQFACGGWMKNTKIPADKSRWSRSFNEIRERNRAELRRILTDAQQGEATDDVSKKIGQFYGACMNEAAIEVTALKPLEPLLKLASGVKDKASLQKALIEFHKVNIPVLFDIGSGQDFKDATQMIALLDQAGLGLPDRDYYVNEGERDKKIRAEYVAHIERMLTLAGDKPEVAKKAAADIMAFETQLAKLQQTRVERRDPNKIYNRVELDGLKKQAGTFPWDEYFKGLEHSDIKEISVNSVPYFAGFSKMLTTVKFPTWQNYLRWHAVRALAPALPKPFVDESFALTKVLTGQEQIEDRWKRCVDATDNALGELLAQAFVKKMFGEDSKNATKQMVKEISDAFERNLTTLDWMDATTRQRAEEKRQSFAYLVGYPDKWKEYDWTVEPKSYASNVLASRKYELQRQLNKIGKPVDRGEWYMTPPTVNAYYDPQKNLMAFPAGILQPPFYSPNASVAVNMGAMGMVVGHELTHGFDDEGSKYDAQGNLHDWWEPEVGKKFEEKGKCIEDQYSKYEAIPGVFLNGKLTEGENIADNGGVKLAFSAYRNMRKDSNEKIVADGFNEDQQFFLAVGQTWCSLARDEAAAQLAKIDPHSPPKWRVIGSLSNSPEFSTAFECKAGTPMRPVNQCNVW